MMQTLTSSYNADELAWVTPPLTLNRDIYLSIKLKEKGKLVIRQTDSKGKHPRVPLSPHKDTDEFYLRITVVPDAQTLQFFTSTEPKEIKYAYI